MTGNQLLKLTFQIGKCVHAQPKTLVLVPLVHPHGVQRCMPDMVAFSIHYGGGKEEQTEGMSQWVNCGVVPIRIYRIGVRAFMCETRVYYQRDLKSKFCHCVVARCVFTVALTITHLSQFHPNTEGAVRLSLVSPLQKQPRASTHQL